MHSTRLIVAAGAACAAVASLAHGQFNYPYYDAVYTVPYQPAGAPVTTPIAVAPFVSPNGEGLYHVIGVTAATLRAQLHASQPFSQAFVTGTPSLDVYATVASIGAGNTSDPITGWLREPIGPSSPIMIAPQVLLQTARLALSVDGWSSQAAVFTGTDPIGINVTMRGSLRLNLRPDFITATSEAEARLYIRYFYIPSPGTGAALGLGLCLGHRRRRNGRGGGRAAR